MAVLFIFTLRVIGAESRHFDDFPTEMHMDQLEASADYPGVTELGAHLFRHVGQKDGQPRFERGDVGGGKAGEVEDRSVAAVDGEGFLVGLEAADQRVDRAVAAAEDVLQLTPDLLGVGDGGGGVVVETGAAAPGVATTPIETRSARTMAESSSRCRTRTLPMSVPTLAGSMSSAWLMVICMRPMPPSQDTTDDRHELSV